MNLDFNLNLNSKTKEENNVLLDKEQLYDILVVGGGPAGLNAALYSKRKGSKIGLIATSLGGQVSDTSKVENYLGFPSLTGWALVQKFTDHVRELAVPMLAEAWVDSVTLSADRREKIVTLTNGDVYRAKALILATGSKSRMLEVAGEAEYFGRGIAYCAICDGPMYRDKVVVVAGGGNSAVEAAIDLSKIAKKVTLVHRSELRADQILIDQLSSIPSLDVLLNTQIKEVLGDDLVTGIRILDKRSMAESILPTEGVFVEIGYTPNSIPFQRLVELNEKGEIFVDSHNRTNVEGIFAAGDVTTIPYKQIILSAADGAKSALAANDYLNSLK
jgi:alkyl hydroperoxide reductase subunit F